MRLLLINPRFPDSFWSFRWALQEMLPGKRATNPPLGLATLAALCPPDWDITIVDENVESVPLAPLADLIGICGMGVQFQRQLELLDYYRGRGYRVVAGGSYASLCPEKYAEHADVVIAGEAEHIWPEFCRDFATGTCQPLYRETGSINLQDSPVPRFDLLKLPLYTAVSLQYSRGCPFRCEFCDIIVMFGRRPRVKSLEQVGRELDALRARGMRRVFFVDDNLIGNKPQAKELLRFLKRYQDEHRYAFSFGTEATLNLAQDEELLRLFRDANFGWVFIGIESPDEESLRETLKTQNLGGDILSSVRRIYAYGIDVFAGFIIGFDHDTLDTFERQYRFIVASGIAVAMIGLLHAFPRTPLYERLQKAGRLREEGEECDNTRLGTNVVPLRMPYDEMVVRYQQLYHRLLSDRGIADRINNKTRYLRNPVYTGGMPAGEGLLIVWRLLVKGILPGGAKRVFHFLRTIPLLRMRQFPTVVADWIDGLSMGEFARRHFDVALEDSTAAEHRLHSVRAAIARLLGTSKVQVGSVAGAAPNLLLSLDGIVDSRFFSQAAVHLEELLQTTRARLTLRIEAAPASQLEPLQRLLARLARYGDRVSILMDEKLRSRLPIDSSVFHLMLGAPGEAPAGV